MKELTGYRKRDAEEYARLQEMAFTKQKIELTIISTNTIRMRHLMLLYFLNKDQAIKHWQGEVQAPLVELQKMRWKNNNKFFPARDYFNNLWKDPFENGNNYKDMIVYIKELIEDGYDLKHVDWDKEKTDFVKAVQTFYNEVSEDISKNRLTKQNVYNLLDLYIINRRKY